MFSKIGLKFYNWGIVDHDLTFSIVFHYHWNVDYYKLAIQTSSQNSFLLPFFSPSPSSFLSSLCDLFNLTSKIKLNDLKKIIIEQDVKYRFSFENNKIQVKITKEDYKESYIYSLTRFLEAINEVTK